MLDTLDKSGSRLRSGIVCCNITSSLGPERASSCDGLRESNARDASVPTRRAKRNVPFKGPYFFLSLPLIFSPPSVALLFVSRYAFSLEVWMVRDAC